MSIMKLTRLSTYFFHINHISNINSHNEEAIMLHGCTILMLQFSIDMARQNYIQPFNNFLRNNITSTFWIQF